MPSIGRATQKIRPTVETDAQTDINRETQKPTEESRKKAAVYRPTCSALRHWEAGTTTEGPTLNF